MGVQSNDPAYALGIVNPQHAYAERVMVVVLCVCRLATTYLVCESKVWHHKVPNGVLNA